MNANYMFSQEILLLTTKLFVLFQERCFLWHGIQSEIFDPGFLNYNFAHYGHIERKTI